MRPHILHYVRFAVGLGEGAEPCNDVNMVLHVHAVYGSIQL
jgi:hypothetical protein